ncbi:probable G-protein coupled receptor 158 [Corythoichthys intestinalis]|uniref:probable G-protein coupled receptor 158 n=1 Tax=Corythoichthys intestinalis TaxID=161448 RepID=UPI0025A4F012|nr:probable G-protein coupled receptor 158 [Corythoichthys intestinalis]XP_061810198.1 metabotropic glycine receptor-like [Nerophis lumbriciformis]
MEAVLRLALLLHVASAVGSGQRETESDAASAAAASDFLRTGDSVALEQANCSRRFELPLQRGRSPESRHREALDSVLHAANLLSLVLQANRSREGGARDVEWYHALVRSLLLGERKIHRAVVSFSSNGPGVHLQATRTGEEIVLQDLRDRTWDHGERHHGVKHKKFGFRNKAPNRDPDDDPRRWESFIPDGTHVKWSAPYLECRDGNYVPRWSVTLSAAFYGLGPNLVPEFRGVVRVDIDLQDVDIDQCSTDGWFAGTHRCNLTTTECMPSHGHGFVLDKYKCHCKKGFYHPDRSAAAGYPPPGSVIECLPCRPGCSSCKDDAPCIARQDGPLRTAVVAFQCVCMLAVFVSMVLVYHFRRNKTIRASGLVLLEAILCGALLLYFPVGILYFQPGVFRCILLRWVRLLGFATVYGTLTLKLYRVLKVFLSRTAQRIPYMTSWRVLRLLAVILLVACWFLAAWTAAVCQTADRKLALIRVGRTPDGLQFSMCLLDPWDYMMALAEFLFLLWAVYLCYAVRTVPSAFHEPRYMAIAVHNELVLSAIFYVIRFTLAPELHPDWMLLLFFTHTHLTVTVTLGLLLIPKFVFAGTQMRDDLASEAYEDELDMGRSGSYLNSSITSAWSEHSLDPEDIREELKKLYSQLEIYKRKKMLANNPHLQKKRSSKKGLGRSLMRRITEIPESVHRQCSREEKDVGDHGSNRNSICVLKKNPFDQTHTVKAVKEETLKNKVFSLKKSHSSYDHVRDPGQDSDKMGVSAAEGSLLDALMGKKLVKKKSRENLDAPCESTESVPLVCKSASAHNLTADKKPLHPRANVLQKSLSVIATAKEKTLGLAGKTSSAEDGPKRPQPRSRDENETKNAVGKVKSAKQSDPVKGKDFYNLSEVCPWEVEDLPTPSENKVQKHVSIAPEETTTVHGGSSKPKKQMLSDQTPSGIRQSKEVQKTNTAREEVCPWEGGENQSGPASGQATKLQEPRSKGENATSNRAEVCPWDFGEPATAETFPLKTAETQGRNTVTGSSLKADVCPWDIPASPASDGTPSPSRSSKPKDSPSKRKGSPCQRTLEKDKLKDGNEEKSRTKSKDKSKPEKQQKVAEVCSWDVGDQQEAPAVEKRKSANVGAAKVKKADVCAWDFAEASDKSPSERSSALRSDPDPAKKADVCPWDFEELSDKQRTSAARRSDPNPAKKADVCPWDSEGPSDKAASERPSTARRSDPNPAKKADVCPWDFEEAPDKTTRKSNPKPSPPKKADVCPWDFDDKTA